jgi:hypothetical protein
MDPLSSEDGGYQLLLAEISFDESCKKGLHLSRRSKSFEAEISHRILNGFTPQKALRDGYRLR